MKLDNEFAVFNDPIEFIFGNKDDYPVFIKCTQNRVDVWYKLSNNDCLPARPVDDYITSVSVVYGGWAHVDSTMIIKSAFGLELTLQIWAPVRNQFGSVTEWITAVYAYQLKNDILKEDVVHTGGTYKRQHYKLYYSALYILRNLDEELCKKVIKLMDIDELLSICDEENLMEAKMMVLRVNHEAGKVHDDILRL